MQRVMRIKVVQMIYGDLLKPDSWFQYVEQINSLYCDIHGYEYIVDRRENIRQDRHGNWTKVESIRDNLHDCDYLLSLEGDCAVYCHSISLEEDIIPLLPADKSVLTTINRLDHNRWGELSAVWSMLFRNNTMSDEIIAVWDNAHRCAAAEAVAFSYPFDEEGWRRYVVPRYCDHIVTLNDYYLLSSQCGYFIRHIAVSSNEQRYDTFKSMWESPMMARNKILLQNKIERAEQTCQS